MTIDMTSWRRAVACLVASVAAVLAVAWAAGDAQATSLDRELRSVMQHGAPGGKQISRNRIAWPKVGVTLALTKRGGTYDRCKKTYVCLFEHARGLGRMIWFKKYGTYKLKAYGMAPNPRKHKGASSFYNYQSGGAKATLIGPNFRLGLSGYGNVPRSMNDRASYVRLSR